MSSEFEAVEAATEELGSELARVAHQLGTLTQISLIIIIQEHLLFLF